MPLVMFTPEIVPLAVPLIFESNIYWFASALDVLNHIEIVALVPALSPQASELTITSVVDPSK